MLSEPESFISWIRLRYVHVKLRTSPGQPCNRGHQRSGGEELCRWIINDEVIGARIVRLAHPARLVNESALLGSGATDSEWWSTP